MEIYHGSSVLVNQPDLRKHLYNCDFGDGFYCTSLYEQAAIRANRRKGFISVFEYTPKNSLRYKVFNELSEEWLDFIIFCRTGGSHSYDIVLGPMADDALWDHVEELLKGRMTRKVFWEYARSNYPTQQICFCTPASLGCLRFTRGVHCV